MGDRLTVRLDEANAEWLADEADDRDRSKAWVLNQAIRAARGEESAYSHRSGGAVTTKTTDGDSVTGEHVTDRHHDGDDLRERVDDLEDRVAELEAREASRDALAEDRYTVDDDESESGHAVPPRGDGRDQPSDTPDGDREDDSGDGDDVTPDHEWTR